MSWTARLPWRNNWINRFFRNLKICRKRWTQMQLIIWKRGSFQKWMIISASSSKKTNWWRRLIMNSKWEIKSWITNRLSREQLLLHLSRRNRLKYNSRVHSKRPIVKNWKVIVSSYQGAEVSKKGKKIYPTINPPSRFSQEPLKHHECPKYLAWANRLKLNRGRSY